MNIAISQSPTREKYPLSIKKVYKRSVTSIIVYAILAIVAWLISLAIFFETPTMLVISTIMILFGFIAILGATVMYQFWYYASYFYDLTDDFIIIKKGPITPQELTIPYERVQDIYVDQDLFDRIFGIYDVHISSATFTSGALAHIDGVEKAAADGLRDVLLTTVQRKVGRKD